MRHVTWALGLMVGLVALGCSGTRFNHIGKNNTGPAVAAGKPSAADLVAFLKRNSEQIQSLQCNRVEIEYRQGFQSYGADAQLACQKPRNFRLVVVMYGSSQVDLGSNAQEFWYYIAKNDPPYVYRCSYQEFERGVQLPFPFQPEWIMEGLGMGEYGPPEKYRVVEQKNMWELVEDTVNSQGQRVLKVTEFSKGPARVQVRGYKLLDARSAPIYTAQVEDVHVIGSVVVPRKVAFNWPEQKLSLTMRIGRSPDQVVLNGRIPPDRAADLFTRSLLQDITTVDLAELSRRSGGPIQPAGGAVR